MKARNLIHARIEENIRAKISRLRAEEPQEDSCKDALQLLIEHSWKRGERLDMQVISYFRRRQGWRWGCLRLSRTFPELGGGRSKSAVRAPYSDCTDEILRVNTRSGEL